MPGVRDTKDVKLGFTEKKFPHLPTRESHAKEAPYPKSKKLDQKKNDTYIEVDDKDPVWLKDKGDHFFKRNDYHAAINAYTKALQSDSDFLSGRLNRATCYIMVRGFALCVEDCDDIVKQINGMKKEELESDQEFYDKIMARTLVKRGAAQAWLSQFDEAVKDI
jgi:dyslexia susceptibility 1 candidate gene 1 protein